MPLNRQASAVCAVLTPAWLLLWKRCLWGVLAGGLVGLGGCGKIPALGKNDSDAAAPSAGGAVGSVALGPWSADKVGQGRMYWRVIWNGRRFIAVGAGNVLVSRDGHAWEGFAASPGKILYGVAANSTLNVAVGADGVIVTSPDGEHWTAQASKVPQRLFAALWVNGQFFVFGDAGTILTSPDGVSWTAHPRVGNYAFHQGIWSGREFVLSSNQGVLVSPDGFAWTLAASSPNRLMDVATNGRMFLAVGVDGTATMWRSTDAATWIPQKLPTSVGISGVVWADRQFVAVGQGGVILTSPDGLAWTTIPSGLAEDLISVTWNGTVLVAVGKEGTILTATPSAKKLLPW